MKYIQSIVFSTVLIGASQFIEAQTVFNPLPSRIVGQAVLQQQGLLTASAINLVEGREFALPEGVAIDTSSSPSILYVVDEGNNRVLAWKNASSFTNGAPKADLVIGQRDLLSTGPQGPNNPNTNLTTGLSQPIAATVDKNGNLYVVDAGNNRILRYPAPFSQTGDFLVPDLIIGQKDFNGGSPNEGQPAPTQKTLSLSSNGSPLRSGIAFDSLGNFWVSDPGNNRVLRFPASAVGSGVANEPSADRVLGHSDFTTVAIPQNPDRIGKNYLLQPAGLAFDPKDRLFVIDDADRVLVYAPPFVNGQLAARIMGVIIPTQQQPNPPSISETTLGFQDSSGLHPPTGVFFVGSNPYVADSVYSRILGYDPFEQWLDEGTAFSPPAKVVIGQPNFVSGQVNRGQPVPSASSLSQPAAGIFSGTDLFVVDSGNNRVLVFPQQSGGSFNTANRLLGQLDFPYRSPNLIEGREFGFVTGGAAVIDASSTPPHLYISDPLNNRVLGFADYRQVNAGTKADLVIGQPDVFTALINWPANSLTQVGDQGLCSPEGLAVDPSGNLYVADGCNGRVVRFPAPFAQPQGVMPRANLVLGQQNIFQSIKDLSRSTMASAYGLAFSNEGDLLVSDPLANRVLFFRKPAGGDFQSGAPASNVIGQRDYSSGSANTFNKPRAISIDADDQLYVADSSNNRIAILPNVRTSGDNPPVLFSITGISNPIGVFVDLNTDEIWVTNTNGNPGQVLRYPKYSTVVNNPAPNGTISPVFGPISITVDPFSNPVIVEAALNRVSFYYPAIDYTSSAGGLPGRLSGNAANYFQRFAPSMLSAIFAFPNKRFGDQTVVNSTIPIPTTLGDVQVFVAGTPAPLLYVSPSQINLQIPSATPVGDVQEIQVVRASTGQVLASWLFRIDSVSPGLFTANASGSGQLLALNQDFSINDGTHPAKAGTYISLFGTGPGVVSAGPPDGQPAQGTISTDNRPSVFINSDFIPDSDVQYSGLAPGFVGLWQINAKIPANVPPGDVSVFVQVNGINSVLDQTGIIRRTTTIRVTQ